MPKECGIDINSKRRTGFPWIPSLINSKENVNSEGRGMQCRPLHGAAEGPPPGVRLSSDWSGGLAKAPVKDHMQLVQQPSVHSVLLYPTL